MAGTVIKASLRGRLCLSHLTGPSVALGAVRDGLLTLTTLHSIAAPQPRLKAAAKRRLEGVGCRRLFGAALDAWLSSGCFRVRRASACQVVSIGRVGSAAHSNKEPSYTATLGTPNNVSTNASLLAAMPPPQ